MFCMPFRCLSKCFFHLSITTNMHLMNPVVILAHTTCSTDPTADVRSSDITTHSRCCYKSNLAVLQMSRDFFPHFCHMTATLIQFFMSYILQTHYITLCFLSVTFCTRKMWDFRWNRKLPKLTDAIYHANQFPIIPNLIIHKFRKAQQIPMALLWPRSVSLSLSLFPG